MQRIPPQLAMQLVKNPVDSPFYRVFANMPDSVPADDQERLRAAALETIEKKVLPAYKKLDRYFNGKYLPASRDSIGQSALPNGDAWYEHLARSFTTTRMTPDEIHRLGLEEVKRIRGEMQEIIDEVGFEGSFQDFLVFLRTDPQFYFDNPDDLYEAYLATSKRIDPELVKLFGVLPRMPYGVKPIPDSIAPDTTTAYYSRPAADGSRAGIYWVNLYKPEVRPKYEIEVLSVHEAMPGHHLQIALQQELGDMPMFRRFLGFTAFVEGWGLYSERLGYDLGLYKDPYSRFGQLTYDMWRAVRLVVDTGMHYKGWTRQQAIDFFKDNAAKTEHDIVNEIDRYIAWPGQALAYKIGQLKMLTLRERAELHLGDDFDVRAFHDELLGGGALPLDILEQRMDDWLTAQMKKRSCSATLKQTRLALHHGRKLAPCNGGAFGGACRSIVERFDARNALRKPGPVRDLDVESGPGIHLQDQRTPVTIDDHIDAKITKSRNIVSTCGRLQDEIPVGNLQTGNECTGIRMFVNHVIVVYAGQCLARRKIDTGTDGTLVQIGLAVGRARRQAHHRHGRIAAIHDHANIRHALIADLGEDRIEMHAVLDQRFVGIAAQAVLAAHRVGNVVQDLAFGHEHAVAQTVVVTLAFAATGHDNNTVAAAAVRRFDDERIAIANDVGKHPHLSLVRNDAVQIGHRPCPPRAPAPWSATLSSTSG